MRRARPLPLLLCACALLPGACVAERGPGGSGVITPLPGDSEGGRDSGEDAGDGGDSGGDSGAVDAAPSLAVPDAPFAPLDADRLLPDLRGYDVVYVHVDTLRADHLAAYGYARETLPRVGGEPWRVIDGLYATGPWTFPSTAALVTGAYPDQSGFTDPGKILPDRTYTLALPTVATVLADAGWATAIYSGNTWVAELTDIGGSFDRVRYVEKAPGRYNLDRCVDRALDWLDTLPGDQPVFQFLQPLDLHLPYQLQAPELGTWGDPDRPWDAATTDADTQTRQIMQALAADPEGATQQLVDAYDESMLGLDVGLRALLDGLEARGRLDHTVVILTADHGETLNDARDAYVGHGQSLREELVRIPFLVRVPGGGGQEREEPPRPTCVAPNRDVLPTLLDALGLPPLATATGGSLQAGCPGVAESSLWADEETLERVAVSDGAEKLERACDGSGSRGWDLLADPHELAPIDPTALRNGAALQASLDAALARIAAGAPSVDCPP